MTDIPVVVVGLRSGVTFACKGLPEEPKKIYLLDVISPHPLSSYFFLFCPVCHLSISNTPAHARGLFLTCGWGGGVRSMGEKSVALLYMYTYYYYIGEDRYDISSRSCRFLSHRNSGLLLFYFFLLALFGWSFIVKEDDMRNCWRSGQSLHSWWKCLLFFFFFDIFIPFVFLFPSIGRTVNVVLTSSGRRTLASGQTYLCV
jgi:hypothetical protein